MGAEKEFYQQPVDRTDYASCLGVAAIVGASFLLAAWALWSAGHFLRTRLSFSLPKVPEMALPSSSPTGILQAAKDAAGKAAQDQLDRAGQAVRDEAAKQVEQQKADIKQDASQQLNDYLKH